jgi:uncharacterized alkaline shock family protein YloU
MSSGDTMANEYILLKQNGSKPVGQIALTKEAFEMITRFTVEDDEALVLDHSPLKKAIVCKIGQNKLNISVDVRVRYGKNVNQIVETLQTRIANNVFTMTDYRCSRIDVNVVGFVFNTQ